MKYWIRKAGIPADRSFTEEELFSEYKHLLTGDTPCARSGENTWATIVEYFPDWQNHQCKLATQQHSQKPEVSFSAISHGEVTIVDIRMPFSSMIVFMVKWSIASIPAFIILLIIFFLVFAIFGGLGGLSR